MEPASELSKCPGRHRARARRALGASRAVMTAGLFLLATVLGAAAAPVSSAPASGAQGNIVGGRATAAGEHPYVVYLADRRGRQYCGGALISPSRVVTAAHCVDGMAESRIWVVAGRRDTRTDEGTVAGVRRIWIPEGYSDPTEGKDIAVLTLTERMPYRTIRPAGSRDGELYAEGRKATVLGWGRTSESGARSPYLRAAQVPMRADRVCSAAYRDYVPEEMACAGYREGGVDACQGDSGGPLVSGGKLIGVVSWGEGCARAGKPGVYTQVSVFSRQLAAASDSGDEQEPASGGILSPILGG